jgi:hypothetical protein
MTLPTIPPLPQQPAPTLDQQLAHLGLQMRVAEHAQRERLNADAERRNAAMVAAHTRLADVQARAAAASERLADLLAAMPNDQPPPAPAPSADADALVTLVSTMTSKQRENPAAAAAAARAQLAALRS